MIWTLSKNPVNLSWFSKNFSSVKSGFARFGVLEQTTICQRQKNFKNFIFFKDVCSFTRQNWDWKVENSKLRQWEKRQKAWPECKQTYTEFFFFSAKKMMDLATLSSVTDFSQFFIPTVLLSKRKNTSNSISCTGPTPPRIWIYHMGPIQPRRCRQTWENPKQSCKVLNKGL